MCINPTQKINLHVSLLKLLLLKLFIHVYRSIIINSPSIKILLHGILNLNSFTCNQVVCWITEYNVHISESCNFSTI